MKISYQYFFFKLGDIPPLKNCGEIYNAGYTRPGFYYTNTDGNMLESGRKLTFCEDGWNVLLYRTSPGNTADIGQTVRDTKGHH